MVRDAQDPTKYQRLFFYSLKNKLNANFLFLFHQKNSESPEIIFLWHFQKAKKVAIKTLMAIKTLAIKTLMDCICKLTGDYLTITFD